MANATDNTVMKLATRRAPIMHLP